MATTVSTGGLVREGDLVATPTPNNAPFVDTTPTPTFTNGVASTYDLDQHMSDPDSDPLTAVMNTGTVALPSGVTLNAAANDNYLSYDGVGSATTSSGHTLTADDQIDTSAASPSFDIVIAAAATADLVVRKDGAGDHTTIQAAINAVSAGEIIEVQAATAGGDETYTESLSFTSGTSDGTDGNEITLRARSGDTIRLKATDPNAALLEIQELKYWKFDGFAQIGDDTWTNGVPYQSQSGYGHEYTIRVRDNSSHLDFTNIGSSTRGNSNKIWGASSYWAVQLGITNSDDGCSHIRFKNCHFELQGNNNNTQGSQDYGDLIKSNTPSTIFDTCTMYQGGHNPVGLMEGKQVIRRCIVDNDWTAMGTGTDGYRAGVIAMDQSDLSPEHILSEHNVWRNGLENPGQNNFPAVVKYQTYQGVIRYDCILTGDGKAFRIDRNNGDDAQVSRGRHHNITIDGVDSIQRSNETETTLGGQPITDTIQDLHFKNFVCTDLGPGDNVKANAQIYKRDEANTGWGTDLYESWSIETAGNTVEIYLNDDTSATAKSITDALADWSTNFQDWDEETCTYSNLAAANTTWNIGDVPANMALTSSNNANNGAVALTTMVGAGSGTSGTIADPTWFVLLDDDFDLGYFGEQNDMIEINGQAVRLTSLNKTTGAATWDTSITWSNGDSVNHYDEVVKDGVHVNRGAIG